MTDGPTTNDHGETFGAWLLMEKDRDGALGKLVAAEKGEVVPPSWTVWQAELSYTPIGLRRHSGERHLRGMPRRWRRRDLLIDLVRSSAAEARVRPLPVVIADPPAEPRAQLGAGLERV